METLEFRCLLPNLSFQPIRQDKISGTYLQSALHMKNLNSLNYPRTRREIGYRHRASVCISHAQLGRQRTPAHWPDCAKLRQDKRVDFSLWKCVKELAHPGPC